VIKASKGRIRSSRLNVGMASKDRISFSGHFRKKNQDVPYGLKKLNPPLDRTYDPPENSVSFFVVILFPLSKKGGYVLPVCLSLGLCVR